MERYLRINLNDYVFYDEFINNEYEIYNDFNYKAFLNDFYFTDRTIELRDEIGCSYIKIYENIYNFKYLLYDIIHFYFGKSLNISDIFNEDIIEELKSRIFNIAFYQMNQINQIKYLHRAIFHSGQTNINGILKLLSNELDVIKITKDDSIKIGIHKNATQTYYKEHLDVITRRWDSKISNQKIRKITDNNAKEIFYYFFATKSIVKLNNRQILKRIENIKSQINDDYEEQKIDTNVVSDKKKDLIAYANLIEKLPKIINRRYKEIIYHL